MVVIGIALVAIILGLIWYSSADGDDLAFSVHDLNWDDIEGMNNHVAVAFYSNPPHVHNASLAPIGHMQELLNFFKSNQDLIRDSAQDDDLEFKVRFTRVTGEEKFLGYVPPSVWQENSGEFELSFHFDSSLIESFLEALNASNDAYVRAENPDAFNEEIITLAEVDWEVLREDYEGEIFAVIIQGIVGVGEYFNIADFNIAHDALPVILEFLEDNQNEFRNAGDLAYTYQGTIHFWQNDDSEPRIMAPFFMDEALNRRLMEAIGDEAWEQARRQ